MSNHNPELLELSRLLNDLANRIHEEKSRTDDPAIYTALNDELIEINHRITIIGGLIFKARADAISEAAKRVEESKDELAEAIDNIDRINQFIRTISSFLGLVDTVIDLAKRV